MIDDEVKDSEPAEEKEQPKKVKDETENPKRHGNEVMGSEAGGEAGEGRTGTKLGSTDS